MPYTSLFSVLNPTEPALKSKSWLAQPSGMTASVPVQYSQNATVVLALAAIETGNDPTSITPPAKLPARHVSGLGNATGEAIDVTMPLAAPLWAPIASVTM